MYRNKKIILAFNIIILVVLCIEQAYAVTNIISSFTGQSNPYNISFARSNNQYFTLEIPQYSYIKNITLDIIGFNDNTFINITASNLNFQPSASSISGTDLTNWFNKSIQTAWIRNSNYQNSVVYNVSANNTLNRRYSVGSLALSNLWVNYSIELFDYKNNVWVLLDNWTTPAGHEVATCYIKDLVLNYTYLSNNKVFTLRENYSNYVDGLQSCTGPRTCDGVTFNILDGCILFLNNNYSQTTNQITDLNISLNGLSTFYNNGNFSIPYSLSVNTSIANNLLSLSEPINISFYSKTAGILQVNLTNATYSYGIDNCSNSFGIPTNATALNFTSYDENNLTLLTLDNVVGTIYIPNYNFTTNYANVNKFSVCIYPYWFNTTVDAYYQYTAGETERYYLNKLYLNNITGLVNLYNFNGTNAIRYDLQETTYNYFSSLYPNLFGKLQRYYPASNSWITVQLDKSDENGRMLYYIYLNSVDYRIIWSDENNNVLYMTDPIKFICADGVNPCIDSHIIPKTSELESYSGMSWIPSYNNNTGIYSLSWTDSNNLISSVTMLVQSESSDRVITICNTTTQSSSGTIVCNVSSYYGTIVVRGIRTASPPNLFFLDTIIKPLQQLNDILTSVGRTNDGIFFAGLIQITFVSFGAMLGGVGCILAGVLGIIIISLLHLASFVTIALAVGVTVLGAVVMIIVKY